MVPGPGHVKSVDIDIVTAGVPSNSGARDYEFRAPLHVRDELNSRGCRPVFFGKDARTTERSRCDFVRARRYVNGETCTG